MLIAHVKNKIGIYETDSITDWGVSIATQRNSQNV